MPTSGNRTFFVADNAAQGTMHVLAAAFIGAGQGGIAARVVFVGLYLYNYRAGEHRSTIAAHGVVVDWPSATRCSRGRELSGAWQRSSFLNTKQQQALIICPAARRRTVLWQHCKVSQLIIRGLRIVAIC